MSVHPSTGEVEYCTAGHPPPIVAARSGAARYLKLSGASPLGGGHRFPTRTFRLDDGEVVMLYSDGLVERPGRAPEESTVEILRVVGACASSSARSLKTEPGVAQRVCQQSLELLTRATGWAYDVTLLVAERRIGASS